MTSFVRLAVGALAVAAVVACGGPDGSTPTSSPAGASTSVGHATSSGDSGTPGGSEAPATGAPAVPSADELVGHLATPADLGSGWAVWEGFANWPGGVPGTIPEDQREMLPPIPMCPWASEAAVALAEGLRWQAFTQLHWATPDPFANMVVLQQFLVAGEPADLAATFATIRDGLTGCLTANRPAGDWEIGLREALVVPEVGDERYAERSSSVDAGGARRDTRWVLVRDEAVLMAIQLDDILISPQAEPVLTAVQVDAVVRATASRLP